MLSKEEAKELLSKAWASLWIPDLPTLADFFTEDAELTAFSPPTQTTHHGIEAIKAHFKPFQSMVTAKSFKIKRIDIVDDGKTFYASWDEVFELKIPGNEGKMEGNGIMYCVLEEGKFKTLTAFEDPTPFVGMAMKGLIPPE